MVIFCLCHGFLSVVVMTLLYRGEEGKEKDSGCHCSIRIYFLVQTRAKVTEYATVLMLLAALEK